MREACLNVRAAKWDAICERKREKIWRIGTRSTKKRTMSSSVEDPLVAKPAPAPAPATARASPATSLLPGVLLRLVLVALPVLTCLLICGSSYLVSENSQLAVERRAFQKTPVIFLVDDVIHRLQKERGTTAILTAPSCIAAPECKITVSATLFIMRSESDEALAALDRYVKDDGAGIGDWKVFWQAYEELKGIARIRAQVDSPQSLRTAEVLLIFRKGEQKKTKKKI